MEPDNDDRHAATSSPAGAAAVDLTGLAPGVPGPLAVTPIEPSGPPYELGRRGRPVPVEAPGARPAGPPRHNPWTAAGTGEATSSTVSAGGKRDP